MRVLVTGSSGFIGKHVQMELGARGHEMIPFDQNHMCDVMLESQLHSYMDRADAVINLAGRLGTAEIIGSERTAAEINIIGALNVYNAAAAYHIPVVQIGTGHKGQPNPYAITKAAAEDLGLSRAQWTGQKISVVRAYHVYGPFQKPPPPHGTSPVRKIIPSFGCRALTDTTLEVWGDGQQKIDLVHAEDVAKALVDATSGPYGQVIEAGTGKPVTVSQVAWDVIREADSLSTVSYLPMRPGEPEGAHVVAAAPVCTNLWPYKLRETLDYLSGYIK